MNHHDADVTDVIVVLDEMSDEQTQASVKLLAAAGLAVTGVDGSTSTVEGCINAEKVSELKQVPGVRYVRSVMTYAVDYPPGDPRDKDGPEEIIEDGED